MNTLTDMRLRSGPHEDCPYRSGQRPGGEGSMTAFNVADVEQFLRPGSFPD